MSILLKKMKFFIFIISVWTLKVCNSLPVTDEEEAAKPGQYPYHAIIAVKSQNQKFPICEGIMLNEEYVLTSAGCVHKYTSSPSTLEAIVGATSADTFESDKDVQIRGIVSIVFPPQWSDSQQKYGDLAVLKVSAPFDKNNYVSGIDGFEDTEESSYLISYGSEDKLKGTAVKKLSQQECEEYLYKTLSPGTFCMKKEKDERSVYNLDYVGAPVATQDSKSKNVFGIYSQSESGVFTLLSYYKEWLESIVDLHKTPSVPSTTKRYPYHTIVAYKSQDQTFLLCEGIIFNEEYVLTAAGCVHKYTSSPTNLEAVAGATSTENFKSDNVQMRGIVSITYPPQWTDSKHTYGDLAALKVSPSFDKNNYVSGIDGYEDATTDEDKSYLIGFGSGTELTSTSVKKLSNEICEEKLYRSLSPGTFCVQNENDEYVFSNSDYAGAPLAIQDDKSNVVYGIYSQSETSVFTSISHHKEWLESVVRKT